MSYRPRTEEQKLRRKYLRDCKRHGVEPMQIDYWKEYNKKLNADWKPEFANKTSKPSRKSVKPAKKVCNKKPEKPITKNGTQGYYYRTWRLRNLKELQTS